MVIKLFDFNKMAKNYGYNLEELTDRELEEAYVKVKIGKKLEKELVEKNWEAPIKQKIWQRFLQDSNGNGRLGIETWFYENGDKDLIKEIEKHRKGNNDFIESFFLYLTDNDIDKEEKYKAIREWLKKGLESQENNIVFVIKGIMDRKSNNGNKRMTF